MIFLSKYDIVHNIPSTVSPPSTPVSGLGQPFDSLSRHMGFTFEPTCVYSVFKTKIALNFLTQAETK